VLGPDALRARARALQAHEATGWYIDDYGRAQVSMNLTNYKVTSPHAAAEAVREEAAKLGLIVPTELVGLIPKEAMLEAGRFYLKKQGRSWGVPEARTDSHRDPISRIGRNCPTFDPKKEESLSCAWREA